MNTRCLRWIVPLTLSALVHPADAAPNDPSANQNSDTPAAVTMRLAPNYPIPYQPASVEQITAVLERVRQYLEVASPIKVVDADTGKAVTDLSQLPEHLALDRGDFLIISYEWGVTYAGMLLSAEATGDPQFKSFVERRLKAVAALSAHLRAQPGLDPLKLKQPLRSLVAPQTLDETGAMSAAMIQAQLAGAGDDNVRSLIDFDLDYLTHGQMRLDDGTLARNNPLPHTLWLDDLYMSVPALAQMGRLTGDPKYYDDAVKQVLQFSQRMFVKEKRLYMHGWTEGMPDLPRFHWARANGWALMAMTELLSVLPKDHPGYGPVLAQFREHARGVAATQGVNGLWHQLMDRPETYEETSASAIFTYCLARAINRGWIDADAYGSTVSLGWNAVAEKVNAQGQVEGTCVGTGMGADPMFYAYRPTYVLAAHGYGPTLLAGAEMIVFRRSKDVHPTSADGETRFTPRAAP